MTTALQVARAQATLQAEQLVSSNEERAKLSLEIAALHQANDAGAKALNEKTAQLAISEAARTALQVQLDQAAIHVKAGQVEAERLESEIARLKHEHRALEVTLAHTLEERARLGEEKAQLEDFRAKLWAALQETAAALERSHEATSRIQQLETVAQTSLQSLASERDRLRLELRRLRTKDERRSSPRDDAAAAEAQPVKSAEWLVEGGPARARQERADAASHAEASSLSRTFSFTARGFLPADKQNVISGRVTVTIDPYGEILSRSVTAVDLALDGIAYTPAETSYVYDPATDRLSIHGGPKGGGPGSFDLELRRSSAERPGPNDFVYYSRDGGYYIAKTTTATIQPP